MKRRVWSEPDGSVKVTTFIEESYMERDCKQLQSDGTIHPDATFVDFDTDEAYQAAVPAETGPRYKWRLVGDKVVVDQSIPDLPHPQQDLLDAIDSAGSLDDVKALLKQVVSQ